MTCSVCPAQALVRMRWGPMEEQAGAFCRGCARDVQTRLAPYLGYGTVTLSVEPIDALRAARKS